MTRQPMADRRPGAPPEIRMDAGGIWFVMAPPGVPPGERLVIRCDTDDGLWVSIQPAVSEHARSPETV